MKAIYNFFEALLVEDSKLQYGKMYSLLMMLGMPLILLIWGKSSGLFAPLENNLLFVIATTLGFGLLGTLFLIFLIITLILQVKYGTDES